MSYQSCIHKPNHSLSQEQSVRDSEILTGLLKSNIREPQSIFRNTSSYSVWTHTPIDIRHLMLNNLPLGSSVWDTFSQLFVYNISSDKAPGFRLHREDYGALLTGPELEPWGFLYWRLEAQLRKTHGDTLVSAVSVYSLNIL